MIDNYRLYRQATRPKERNGTCVQLYVAVQAIAKLDYENDRYFMVNEFVAYYLGEALGIPVCLGTPLSCPVFHDGAIVSHRPHWGSLAVSEGPPLPDIEQFVRLQPNLAAGIIVFDGWIGNRDRHERNLHYDKQNDRVYLFDHGEAICNRVGPSYLANQRSELGFSVENCLASEITKWDEFDTWFDTLESVHVEYIRTVVRMTKIWGMSTADQDELVDALDERKRNLRNIFVSKQDDRVVFPGIRSLLRLEPKS